jgi:hypothetical protein
MQQGGGGAACPPALTLDLVVFRDVLQLDPLHVLDAFGPRVSTCEAWVPSSSFSLSGRGGGASRGGGALGAGTSRTEDRGAAIYKPCMLNNTACMVLEHCACFHHAPAREGGTRMDPLLCWTLSVLLRDSAAWMAASATLAASTWQGSAGDTPCAWEAASFPHEPPMAVRRPGCAAARLACTGGVQHQASTKRGNMSVVASV